MCSQFQFLCSQFQQLPYFFAHLQQYFCAMKYSPKHNVMKKLLLITGLIGAFLMFHSNVTAQVTSNQELTMGIPEVLLINAVDASGNTGAVSLELTTTTAGTGISGGTGTSYVQLSSIVTSSQTRVMTASVTGVPAGTALALTTAIPSNANFAGTVGTGTSSVELSGTAANIVTGIGSCYTGTAALDGYQLDFTWDAGDAGDYGTIFATGATTATVVLTISTGS